MTGMHLEPDIGGIRERGAVGDAVLKRLGLWRQRDDV
jgi:hypothetical protein